VAFFGCASGTAERNSHWLRAHVIADHGSRAAAFGHKLARDGRPTRRTDSSQRVGSGRVFGCSIFRQRCRQRVSAPTLLEVCEI
jgi:hypothetical protein